MNADENTPVLAASCANMNDSRAEASVTAVAALASPPADDVRDLLIEAIDGCIPEDIPGYRQRYTDKAADAILAAFEVRLRGTVTDAEVEAGARVLDPDAFTGRGYGAGAARQSREEARRTARDVLTAATEARS